MQTVQNETLDDPTLREVVRLRILDSVKRQHPGCRVEVKWVGFYEVSIVVYEPHSITIRMSY